MVGMKGVVLAGGTGSRMKPLTNVTNKHLLPVYNKPMIEYPLDTLVKAGIKDILVVSGREHAGRLFDYLGSGRERGINLMYEQQDEAGGIAQALGLAKSFVGRDNLAVILGDNIFEDVFDFSSFDRGAMIFLKEVSNPQRFGVAKLDRRRVIGIEEKPEKPATNYAVTGLYLYDPTVFGIIETLRLLVGGELEITDVNNKYIDMGKMSYKFVKGRWTDAGTFPSLLRAHLYAARKVLGDEGVRKLMED